jgi:hypothetical protein
VKKIPTIFERDWEGDRSRVLDQQTPGCEWVFAGEGVARQKVDGTCVLMEGGVMYKRHEVREGKETPANFRQVEVDETTGKVIGWVPVGDGPEDKWHREAYDNLMGESLDDGTYELLGPKVQKNPEGFGRHQLVRHDQATPYIVPRTFEGMRDLLAELDVEGFVFHHEDGRMAKIKARDFGIKRKS